jgi:hypothetical protein
VVNRLFRALADGTRRDILARSLTETPTQCLLNGAVGCTRLAAPIIRFGMCDDSFGTSWILNLCEGRLNRDSV